MTVVLLREIPSRIPKGSLREDLQKRGFIQDVCFQRYMANNEVVETIKSSFNHIFCDDDVSLEFLRATKSSLIVAKFNWF